MFEILHPHPRNNNPHPRHNASKYHQRGVIPGDGGILDDTGFIHDSRKRRLSTKPLVSPTALQTNLLSPHTYIRNIPSPLPNPQNTTHTHDEDNPGSPQHNEPVVSRVGRGFDLLLAEEEHEAAASTSPSPSVHHYYVIAAVIIVAIVAVVVVDRAGRNGYGGGG